MPEIPAVRARPARLDGAELLLASVAVVLAYLLSRLLLVWRFPPFFDEALYAAWTLQGFEDIHDRFISLANGKEPLLTWIGMGWMTLGADPLTAVRLVSVASGLVTLVMVALIARHFWGDRVALVAAALYAVIPFVVVHDSLGLMESLVTATAMSALYVQIRFAERPALDLALLLGIAFAAGLLTKETGRFALVLLPLSLVCFDWRPPRVDARLVAWIAGSALALVMAGIGYSILMLSDYWDDLGPSRDAIDMHRATADAFSQPWRHIADTGPSFLEALVGYVTLPLLGLFAFGAVAAMRTRPRAAALLLGWTLLPLASALLLAYVTNPRYIVMVVPPIAVLAALGLVRLWDWTATRRGTVIATAAVVLLTLPALAQDTRVLADPAGFRYPGRDDGNYATGWPAGRAWERVAGELEHRAEGRPLLVQLGERGSPALGLLLRREPNIRIVSGSDPLGPAAPYAIENGDRLDRRAGLLVLRPLWEAQRPRGGTPLRLLARGPVWAGEFYSTPDALREGLGLPDSEFDAFLASHPEVRAWYRAWFGEWREVTALP